jgi:hypothetical protein
MTIVYRNGIRLVGSHGGLGGDYFGSGLDIRMNVEQLQPGDTLVIERRFLGITWSVREFEILDSPVPAQERILDYAMDREAAGNYLAERSRVS